MECTICHEYFTPEGPHQPKVLPCGHSFCRSCVDRLAQTSGRAQQIECPNDRKKFPLSAVTTNFQLKELLQSNQTAPQQQGMCTPGTGSARAIIPAPQQALLEPSAPNLQPWEIGPQIAYYGDGLGVGRRGAAYLTKSPVPPPVELGPAPAGDASVWIQERRRILRDWGQRREQFLHRRPRCLMDQMVSGSGFFPPRLLDDLWFTEVEKAKMRQLSPILNGTGNDYFLSRDMMTFLLHDVDVRIILDNSGSMQLDMLQGNPQAYGGWSIEQTSIENPGQLERTLNSELPPRGRRMQPASGGISPFHRRWYLARDALRKWMRVFEVLGIAPWVYLLNPGCRKFQCRTAADVEQIFLQQPAGTTPMTEALQKLLWDFGQEVRQVDPIKPTLALILTDGEANDMPSFNRTLDEIQNGVYGDVQVCLMGLSLVKRDVEWFENEECDETRIRTVEAYEFEHRQIQLREVVAHEGGYNFAMHTFRVLLTNFFPADYDYEAHIQNLRHRLYITWHGRDRWRSLNNCCYKCLCSNLVCGTCFLVTCCHCRGWCQGNECGKYECPDCMEGCCEDEG